MEYELISYISIVPIRLSNPMLLTLSQGTKSSTKGGFCFSELPFCFDFLIGYAQSFGFNEELVLFQALRVFLAGNFTEVIMFPCGRKDPAFWCWDLAQLCIIHGIEEFCRRRAKSMVP